MALTIDQISAVSYPAVLAEMRKPANQWADNSALDTLEKMGFIKHIGLGETIEAPLDYRPNPDTAILVSDQDTASLLKTEVLTSASYEVAQISVAATWTKGDDAKNPEQNQKVSLVRAILQNAIESHDDLLEQSIFTTSAVGGVELNGLDTIVPTSGQGTVGGIDAGVETWWRNFADTYTDASDIEAAMTEAWNEAMKGSTSPMKTKLLLSGSEPHVLYESGLQALQRFSGQEGKGAFTSLMFKDANYVFSQYGGENIYFLNPKSYQIIVSKQYFRDKGNTEPVPGQNAFYFLIYSALQMITNNKSRLAVLSQA